MPFNDIEIEIKTAQKDKKLSEDVRKEKEDKLAAEMDPRGYVEEPDFDPAEMLTFLGSLLTMSGKAVGKALSGKAAKEAAVKKLAGEEKLSRRIKSIYNADPSEKQNQMMIEVMKKKSDDAKVPFDMEGSEKTIDALYKRKERMLPDINEATQDAIDHELKMRKRFK